MEKASNPDHVTILVTFSAIWYHLYHLKKIKPATLVKVTLLYGCFSRFLNYTNVAKSSKGSHLVKVLVLVINMNLRKINSFPIGPDHTTIYFVFLRNLEGPRLFYQRCLVPGGNFQKFKIDCFSAYSKISASFVLKTLVI